MNCYKTCLNWLKFQESEKEYESLDNQLLKFSQNFKNEKIQEMFHEHQKAHVISLFRICTLFQIIMNTVFCFNVYFTYNAQEHAIFRGLFAFWLIFTLIMKHRLSFLWINKINFLLVLNSFIHVAIFAHYYVTVLRILKSQELIIEVSLSNGFTQSIFAVSYFLICPSWQCQIIIVLGYFFTIMKLSYGFMNFRLWYPTLIILFVCIVIRMKDKNTKLMFLQVHKQKSNIMACKDIFDQCVPSSIIIIKIIKPQLAQIQISEQELLNVAKSNHFEVLYANKFAQQYLRCSSESNCASQIDSIQVIQDDDDDDRTKCLIDVLTSEPWNQIIRNHPDDIEYALGSEQQLLSCCIQSGVSNQKTAIKRQTQYCDVQLKSCVWEGEQSIIIVLNDTTDRITRIEELKDLNSYKDQLLATVSHDLKTPLNGTQLLLYAMKGICKTKKNLEIVDIKNLLQNIKDIYLSNCMLITMINDLLDYSQIRKGALRLQIEKFPLDECIDSVYSLFHRQTSSKKLKLIFQKGNFLGPLILETDQNRLKQILINLVSNSLKFTFEGEILLKIVRQEPFIEFMVKDTGIGMPHSVVEKLFKQYATFNLGNKNSQGVGLGLVISSKLVGLLGPSEVINIESEQGVGTTFSFKIYRSLITKQNAQEIDEGYNTDFAQQPNLTEKSTKFISINKNQALSQQFQVLIVDDTVFNIQAFKAIVSKIMNCEVTEFYNGLDALKSVQSGMKYDVIFMDIEMPVMDGYTATKLIRKYENEKGNKPSVIIIASAYTMEQELHRVQESEADGHIEKPVQIKKLVELLKRHKLVD